VFSGEEGVGRAEYPERPGRDAEAYSTPQVLDKLEQQRVMRQLWHHSAMGSSSPSAPRPTEVADQLELRGLGFMCYGLHDTRESPGPP
jgi:hypothetical protein